MARTGNVRVRTQGVDTTEEHESQERAAWLVNQAHAPKDLDNCEDQQEAAEAPLDRPPSYQETPEQSEPRLRHLPQALAYDHDLPTDGGARPPMATNSRRWSCRRHPVLTAVLGAAANFLIALCIQQLMSVKIFQTRLGGNDTEIQKGLPNITVQGLYTTYRSPMTVSAVPGLYMIPATTTHGQWSYASDGFSTHISGEDGKDEPHFPTVISKLSIGRGTESRKQSSVPTSSIAKASCVLSNRRGQDKSTHWGVEIPYGLHERALSHAMQVQKAWCMHNTCSTGQRLQAMCNNTNHQGATQKKKNNAFEEQECKWCWDEKLFPARNPTQEAAIERHCEDVSRHAATLLFIVCGLLFGLVIIPVAILTQHILPRRKIARAVPDSVASVPALRGNRDRCWKLWHSLPSSKPADASKGSVSPDQKVGEVRGRSTIVKDLGKPLHTNRVDNPSCSQVRKSRDDPPNATSMTVKKQEFGDRVPIMPPAKGQRVLSHVENTDHARFSDREVIRTQSDRPELPRKSSKRMRAVSSGSQHISLSILSQNPFKRGREDGEATRDM